MNEVNAEQLQSIFGTVANIEREVKSQQRVIEQTTRILGNELPDITKHLTSLRDVKEIVNSLINTAKRNNEIATNTGQKTVDEISKLNTSITSSNKEIEKSINEELNKYGTKQGDTMDKFQSALSSNFKTVSETFLSKSDSEKTDPFKTHIDNIITVLGGKLDAFISVNTQSAKKETKPGTEDTGINDLLKRQIEVLERTKTSTDKKLVSLYEAITKSDTRAVARERREKTTPPEINLSRRDRKLLTTLDAGSKFDALLHEVKDTKKTSGGSPLLKLVSPLMYLLGGIGALAFGVFKFPTVKKMFDTFTKTSIGGGVMSFFKSLEPKGKSVKEIIRNIPFIGRMVDLWDALSLMHKGNYKAGFKQLAFAIPGAEYLALLLDTSKERLLSGVYDKGTDTSIKIPFLGNTAEQIFNGVSGGITSIFQPVISFFTDGFGALGDVFNLLKKGVNINYNDVATSLDSISTNYFPSLKPIANIFKSLAKSSFDWTASKLGSVGDINKNIQPINIGDVLSTAMSTITDKITRAFNTISELLSGLGMVFSGDEATQHRGLLILDRYAPGITQGIRTFLNVMDGIKSMINPDGTISRWKLLTTDLSTEGKYSRQSSYMSVLPESQKKQLEMFEGLRKQITQQTYSMQQRQGKKTGEEMTGFEHMQNLILSDSLFKGMVDPSIRGRIYNTKAERDAATKKLREAMTQQRDIGAGLMENAGIPKDYLFPAGNTDNILPLETPTLQTSPFTLLNPGKDKFQLETQHYRGYLERDKVEVNKQYEVQEKLFQLINGPVMNMLKESAFNGKKQTSYLEQTTKGIASLGDAPRNNVVVSSVNNSINPGNGSNILTSKMNALGSRGMV